MWENLADLKILVKIATSKKKQPVVAGCAKILSSQEVWCKEEEVKKKSFPDQ